MRSCGSDVEGLGLGTERTLPPLVLPATLGFCLCSTGRCPLLTLMRGEVGMREGRLPLRDDRGLRLDFSGGSHLNDALRFFVFSLDFVTSSLACERSLLRECCDVSTCDAESLKSVTPDDVI